MKPRIRLLVRSGPALVLNSHLAPGYAAEARVHRCVDANGRVYFSDLPGGGLRTRPARSPNSNASGRLRIATTVHCSQLIRQKTRSRPRNGGAFGHCGWRCN
jgi:hypothetical protein